VVEEVRAGQSAGLADFASVVDPLITRHQRTRWAAWRPVDLVNRTAFLRLLEHCGVEISRAQ
jgi:hypothetical protein